MKKADWIFLAVAAGLALVVWYFFARRGAPGAALFAGSSGASQDQNHFPGSGIVMPDASEFAAGHYNIDYTQL